MSTIGDSKHSYGHLRGAVDALSDNVFHRTVFKASLLMVWTCVEGISTSPVKWFKFAAAGFLANHKTVNCPKNKDRRHQCNLCLAFDPGPRSAVRRGGQPHLRVLLLCI